jgi:hypothetical protein
MAVGGCVQGMVWLRIAGDGNAVTRLLVFLV